MASRPTTGSRRVPDAPKDWEDQYHRLQDRFNSLTVEYNEKVEHNKHLQSKIRKLESDLAQMEVQMGLPRGTHAAQDRDAKEMVDSLSQQLAKVKAQNSALQQKNQQLTAALEKKTRQLQLAKQTAYLNKRPASSTNRVDMSTMELDIMPGYNPLGNAPQPRNPPTPMMQPASPPQPAPQDPDLLIVARKLKEANARLEQEVSSLRSEITVLHARANAQPVHSDAEAKLRETSWKLQQLQAQYDFVVKRQAAAEQPPLPVAPVPAPSVQIGRHVESNLEEAQNSIRNLKRALEDLRREKEISDSKANRVTGLEDLVSELRQANRSLEEKIARLCEAPFISDAFGQHEASLKYSELLEERENLKRQLEHLQEAVRTQYSAANTLQQQASAIRAEKDKAEKEVHELRLKLAELEHGSLAMQDKLRLYADDVDLESLERALTIVKRRHMPSERLPFLNYDKDDAEEELLSMPALVRKLDECKVMNMRLAEESERLEHMLRLQTNINQDLNKELQALVMARDKDTSEHTRRAAEFETLAVTRLEKIHSLEAQLRQYVYGLSKHSKTNAGRLGAGHLPPTDEDDGEISDDGAELVAELLGDGAEVPTDQNLLEVWIKEANINEGALAPGSSTFVVVDFFDYQSQTTPVVAGHQPKWDFAASYRLSVDDFLLRYLATDVLTLELNIATQGDFSMLARCAIPMSPLLKSRPRLKLRNHPLLSTSTGAVVATISLDIRLALPISELYQLFLQRRPDQRRQIEELAAKRVSDAAMATRAVASDTTALVTTTENAVRRNGTSAEEDATRLYNELEVTIHGATGLQSKHLAALAAATNAGDEVAAASVVLPTPYVHFQLLDHADKFTRPAFQTTDPQFGERFVFPVTTNDHWLRLISRSKMQVYVLDMTAGEENAPNGARRSQAGIGLEEEDILLGEAAISLVPLSNGQTIADKFTLRSGTTGEVTGGTIQITVRWRFPFRRQLDLGPNSLSGVELETLVSAFCPNTLPDGVVDYKSFCRFVHPSASVIAALDALRAHLSQQLDKTGESSVDYLTKVFSGFDGSGETNVAAITSEMFSVQLLKLSIEGVSAADWHELFDYLDAARTGILSIDRILGLVAAEDCSASLPIALQRKIIARVSDLNSRGVKPLQLFRQADQHGADGLVTRGEFKSVLRLMGFHLVDEPESVSEVINARSVNNQLNDGGLSGAMLLTDSVEELELESGTRVVRSELAEFMKKQRDLFEARKSELQSRSNAVEIDRLAMTPRDTTLEKCSITEHSVGVNVPKTPVLPRELDKDVKNAAATAVQARFRGYKTRLESSPPTENNPVVSLKIPDIMTVEELIRSNLASHTQHAGEKSVGPLLASIGKAFSQVDSRRLGTVNRQQFAHALTQFPVLGVTGVELRSLMDYFDSAGDGRLLDYPAFLRFLVAITSFSPLPAMEQLAGHVVFSPRLLAVFQANDPTHIGELEWNHFLTSWRRLGYFTGEVGGAGPSWPDSRLAQIATLFEGRNVGSVAYLNLLEFIHEGPASIELENLVTLVYDKFTRTSPVAGSLVNSEQKDAVRLQDHLAREWFAAMDIKSQGGVSPLMWLEFCSTHNIQASKSCLLALYAEWLPEAESLNPSSAGAQVVFSSFYNWLQNFSLRDSAIRAQQSLFPSLRLVDLQRKCQAYLMEFAKTNGDGTALPNIASIYEAYDWKNQRRVAVQGASGQEALLLDRVIFLKITLQLGFPLTYREITTVADHFAAADCSSLIFYKRFLSWVAPPSLAKQQPKTPLTTAKTLGTEKNSFVTTSTGGVHHTSASVQRLLEKKLCEGVDLYDLFSRYDSSRAHLTIGGMGGQLSPREFSRAFQELGLSSLSAEEALIFAEKNGVVKTGMIEYVPLIANLTVSILQRRLEERFDNGETANEVFAPFHTSGLAVDLQSLQVGMRTTTRVLLAVPVARLVLRRLNAACGGGTLTRDAFFAALDVKVPPHAVVNQRDIQSHEYDLESSPAQEAGGVSFKNLLNFIRKRVEDTLGGANAVTGEKLRSLFESADHDRSGTLDSNEFIRILKRLGCDLRPVEFDALFKILDADGSGKLDYGEFVNLLIAPAQHSRSYSVERSSSRGSSVPPVESIGSDLSVKELISIVRLQIEAYCGKSSTSGEAIGKLDNAFQELDYVRSGELDPIDVRRVFNQFRVELRPTELAALLRAFSHGGGGRFSYVKFVEQLVESASRGRGSSQGPGPEKSVDSPPVDVLDVLRYMKRRLIDSLGPDVNLVRRVREAFEEADRYGRGSIEGSELESIFGTLRVNFRPEEISVLQKKFAIRDGNVEKFNYVEFCSVFSAIAHQNSPSPYRPEQITAPVYRGREDVVKVNLRDVLMRIRQSLDSIVESSAIPRLRTIYEAMDTRQLGRLDREGLSRGLQNFHVDLRPSEMDVLSDHLDIDGSGQLDYNEFLHLLSRLSGRGPSEKNSRSPAHGNAAPVSQVLRMMALDLEVSTNLRGADAVRRLGELMRDADYQGRGELDRVEVDDLFRRCSINPRNLDECDAVFSEFSRGGRFEYREFLRALERSLSSDGAQSVRDVSGPSRETNHYVRRSSSPPATVENFENILQKVRTTALSKIGTGRLTPRYLNDLFQECDVNRSGRLNVSELGRALDNLGVHLNTNELSQISRKFGDSYGDLDVRQFLRLMNREEHTADESHGTVELDTIIREVRRVISVEIGPGIGNLRKLGEAFRRYDRDGSGSLSADELGQALSTMKVRLTSQELAILVRRFDKNSSGMMDFKEFLDLLEIEEPQNNARSNLGLVSTPSHPRFGRDDSLGSAQFDRFGTPGYTPMGANNVGIAGIADRPADNRDVLMRVRRALQSYFGAGSAIHSRLGEKFREIDRNGNGRLDRHELSGLFSRMRIELSHSDIDAIVRQFDHDGSGQLNYDEFLDMIGRDDASSRTPQSLLRF